MIQRLLCLTLLLSTACSSKVGEEAAASDQVERGLLATVAATAGNRIIGTIEAKFDGEERTWYVLEGTVNGERQTSAFWYERESGALRAMIAGYDTPDVPFDTFGRPGAPTGDYTGSALSMIIAFRSGENSGSIPLPSDNDTAVLYMPSAAEGPLFGISDGRLEVTTLNTPRPGTGRIAGVFSGTMSRPPNLDEPFPVTDGRFDIEELEYREELPGAKH